MDSITLTRDKNSCNAPCHVGPQVDYLCDRPAGHEGMHSLTVRWDGPECTLPVTAAEWFGTFGRGNNGHDA